MLTRVEIDDILKLIDGSDFTELKLEQGAAPQPAAPPPLASPPLAPTPAAVAAPVVSGPVQVAAQVVASGGGAEVPAPLLGTFWHAPRPGAEPFVKPGDVVTADTVIGIIEVMKLMNSVAAGVAGRVMEILAPNGEMVEHGQPLIRIQP